MSKDTMEQHLGNLHLALDDLQRAAERAGIEINWLVLLGSESTLPHRLLTTLCAIAQTLRVLPWPVPPTTDLERVALADRGSEADLDPSRIPPRRIEQPWYRRRP